jgi:hypothetical protein
MGKGFLSVSDWKRAGLAYPAPLVTAKGRLKQFIPLATGGFQSVIEMFFDKEVLNFAVLKGIVSIDMRRFKCHLL